MRALSERAGPDPEVVVSGCQRLIELVRQRESSQCVSNRIHARGMDHLHYPAPDEIASFIS